MRVKFALKIMLTRKTPSNQQVFDYVYL